MVPGTDLFANSTSGARIATREDVTGRGRAPRHRYPRVRAPRNFQPDGEVPERSGRNRPATAWRGPRVALRRFLFAARNGRPFSAWAYATTACCFASSKGFIFRIPTAHSESSFCPDRNRRQAVGRPAASPSKTPREVPRDLNRVGSDGTRRNRFGRIAGHRYPAGFSHQTGRAGHDIEQQTFRTPSQPAVRRHPLLPARADRNGPRRARRRHRGLRGPLRRRLAVPRRLAHGTARDSRAFAALRRPRRRVLRPGDGTHLPCI